MLPQLSGNTLSLKGRVGIGRLGLGWVSLESRMRCVSERIGAAMRPRRPRLKPRDISKLLKLTIAEAVDEMIVHHSDGLHVGVDDGRADEVESALLEVFAEGVRFR